MGLRKAELHRGFNIFTEEVRAGAWCVALVGVPVSDGGERRGPNPRSGTPPEQGRLPGEHPSKASALTAAKAHIDRIHQNRRSRTGQRSGTLAGSKAILIPGSIRPS
jgi:hypothetical protein